MEQNEQARRNGFAGNSAEKREDGSMREKISNYAERAQHTAEDVAERAAGSANQAISSVGQKVSSVAGSIRRNSPESGKVGAAASAVADTLDSAGNYLSTHDLSSIEKDAVSLVKQYPLCSLGIGVLAGAFLGRFFARR